MELAHCHTLIFKRLEQFSRLDRDAFVLATSGMARTKYFRNNQSISETNVNRDNPFAKRGKLLRMRSIFIKRLRGSNIAFAILFWLFGG